MLFLILINQIFNSLFAVWNSCAHHLLHLSLSLTLTLYLTQRQSPLRGWSSGRSASPAPTVLSRTSSRKPSSTSL